MNIAPLIAALTAGAAVVATALPGVAVAGPEQPQTIVLTLTGAAEGPGLGDPDGHGTAELRIDPDAGQLCYTVTVSDIAPAEYAHIHKSPVGVGGGPIVVMLDPPSDGSSEGCVAISPQGAGTLLTSPADFYLNIHNADYPGGAIRAQLG